METALKRIKTWSDNGDDDAVLNLSGLKLQSLPQIPKECKRLDCSRNKLTDVPELKYVYLSCYNNSIKKLPNLDGCIELECSENQLDELPKLPACVSLHCINNKLKQLPELPMCRSLYCSHNELTSLPELSECILLRCSNNNLTKLPPLPNCVELDCHHNKISEIVNIVSCAVINCFDNNLAWLPFIPRCHTLVCYPNRYLYLNINQIKQLHKYAVDYTKNYNHHAIRTQHIYKKQLRGKIYEQLLSIYHRNIASIVVLFI